MATPVSKKVQVDRRNSFLDNITAKVDEEQKRKERKEAERGRGGKGNWLTLPVVKCLGFKISWSCKFFCGFKIISVSIASLLSSTCSNETTL